MHKANELFKFFLFVLFLFSSKNPLSAQEVRGLYVNDFKEIIGDPILEDALLEFAQQEEFNYLLLYNLYFIHRLKFPINELESSTPLAAFIHKAKTKYGIKAVGAVGETFKSFGMIDAYNQLQVDPLKRFDVYNMEFEFWNSKLVDNYYCPAYLEDRDIECSTSGAFEFYLDQIKQLNQLAHSRGVKSEVYIGAPTEAQCKLIGENIDRVLVHFYRKSDTYKNGNSIYNYKKGRIAALAPSSGTLTVMPIFSSRPNHIGPWLESHPKEQVYETFMNGQKGYKEATGDWKNHIKLEGVQWYRYTDMVYYTGIPSESELRNSSPTSPTNLENVMSSAPSPFTVNLNKEIIQGMSEGSEKLTSAVAFPNPTDQEILISTENMDHATYKLYNLKGQIMDKGVLGPDPMTTFNTSKLKNGIYYLIFYKGTERETKKIVVSHE